MNDIVMVDGFERPKVCLDDARRELERLLADPTFKSPERNKCFLRFVANEYFEGRAESVKAYAIAVDVFGRPPTFDPSLDPIVRIEAVRLRSALNQYYDTRPDLPLRIDLPKGRYVPVFSIVATPAPAPTTRAPKLQRILKLRPMEDETGEAEPRLSAKRIAVAASCAAIVVVAAAAFGFDGWTRPVFSEKPTVALEMKMADPADSQIGQTVLDGIMVGLSQFQTLRLVSQNADQSAIYTSAIGKSASTVNRTDAYRISMRYSADTDGQSLWWQVVDGKTGEALRSGSERVLSGTRLDSIPSQELATKVATRLASDHGVINDLEMTRELAAPSLGNGCLLRAVSLFGNPDSALKADAIDCLQATLTVAPHNAQVMAAQAMMLSRDSPAQALDLANKAVMLAPFSDKAKLAQSVALFDNGKIDAAIASGYRAMSLNPANSGIAAKLGLLLFLSGRWDDGVGLAIRSGLIESYPQPDAALTLALEAYRTGQYDEAALRARQLNDGDEAIADILLVATLGQHGDTAEATPALSALKKERPDFEAAFRRDLTARHYSSDLVDQIQAGLVKAGASIP